MSRTITAYFDTRSDAQAAYDRLLAAGIAVGDIRIHDAGSVATTGTHTGDDKGFWASLGDLFMPDEDRYTYEEGLRRGGSMLTVTAERADFEAVSDILEDAGAVDLDTREAEWRSEGWRGSEASTVTSTSTSVSGLAASGIPAGAAAGSTHGATTSSTSATLAAGGAETLSDYVPIAEETLRVGKREVDHGRVRIRSYVVETPVEETVALRNETVRIERNPVDRAAVPGDNLFREQTLEATARGEEAVVSKDTRVVEEVRLDKDVQVRDETVRDSVRRTQVEVEDERTGRTIVDDEDLAQRNDVTRR